MGLCPEAAAQETAPSDSTSEAQVARLSAAYDAFRTGDRAAALRAVADAASLRDGQPKDLSEAAQLLTLSAWLRNDSETELAGEVGLLAIERFRRAQAVAAPKEKARLLVTEGEIFERIAVDPGKALAAYAQALGVDPENGAARQGLERLEASEAQDLIRREENALAALRARAAVDAAKDEVVP